MKETDPGIAMKIILVAIISILFLGVCAYLLTQQLNPETSFWMYDPVLLTTLLEKNFALCPR